MQCHDIAVRDDLHVEPVFEEREIGVIFAEKIGDQPVIVKRDNQALGRGKGCMCGQDRCMCQLACSAAAFDPCPAAFGSRKRRSGVYR